MNLRLLRRFVAMSVLLVSAGIIAAPVWSAAAPAKRPLVKISGGPPATTNYREAAFRFQSRSKSTKISCKLDDRKYRRCRNRVTYAGLSFGTHRFTVRASLKGRTAIATRRWKIVRPTKVPTAPAPGRTGTGTGTGSSAAPAPGATTTTPSTGAPSPAARLIFSDEFNGTTLDRSAWGVYEGAGHAGNGSRKASALTLEAGNLTITGSMAPDGTIVSGGMAQRTNFTYGRVEFRVRTEADPTGTMSGVVLTWPLEQWSPEFTENDMYETGARTNNTTQFNSFIHFGLAADKQKWTTHFVDPTQWHTIVMDWQPTLLEIYIDDRLSFSVNDPMVIPDIQHHVSIQLDTRATRTLAKPIRMFVDYVRVYQ